jgi:hypothetical protein
MHIIRDEILIEATPENVWSTLVDLSSWPTWNTSFLDMKINGAQPNLEIGTSISFTTCIFDPQTSSKSTARITHYVPNRAFTWIAGPGPWWLEWMVYGEHWFELEETLEMVDGQFASKTRVSQGENIGGIFSTLFSDTMRCKLRASIATSNTALKRRVEGRL